MAAREDRFADAQTSLSVSASLRWYAVHTKPAKEDVAVGYIARLGLEAFNPQIKKKQKVWGLERQISRPLFPCYVFAKFSDLHLHAVKYARGVRQVVRTGGVPTPLDEQIIESIRSRTIMESDCEHSRRLVPGDPVVINCGTFYGLEGVFEKELSDQERVSILLTTIKWQARVLVEKSVVVKRRVGST